ncbi:MAG: ABC transporter ATP-binding protein [Betaproteobacteria bacterium CG2_30_68_42]|nr:MAG: ABC transporter ATP-binding protein [Betaproteobacteria bacterium CG2_30_68_42]PIX75698.1 MAG: ABC transporter ATP-binding protein [Rhodocyclales bacterium CG_4_10_14_3_um_filter_68_10]PJA56661.1 MAG: ABC transporter ATP-binding protein [Rhodocyclales bacterium CG_4_9_14_3_um_filter_68_10]
MLYLEAQGVHTWYDTSHILFDVSLEVHEGESVCLLGRNGAGKTTTLKTLMGLVPARSGAIRFNGTSLTGREPYEIARLGVGYVPDERLIFPDLTVRENLELGIKKGRASGPSWTVERVYEIFPVLIPLDRRLGGYLSGGEQQMLTIGRTLMGHPSLLLLDEPVEGVAPVVVQELTRQILKLKGMGLTILFAEQNMHFAQEVSDRAYVIEKGRIRFHGTMHELQANDEVKSKYLMI